MINRLSCVSGQVLHFRPISAGVLAWLFLCLSSCGQAGSETNPADHDMHAGHASHPAASHEDHAAHQEMMAAGFEARKDEAEVRLSSEPMRDQTGAPRKLKGDVAGDKVMVVDFIFTSCQTICPVTTSLLVEARERLKDVPESELQFVSMSIDANTDTPERLKAFSERHRADWTFLTGEKAVLDKALNEMDAYSTNPEDHAPMILIGDASTGRFIRLFGLPDPARVEQEVRNYLMRREIAKETCSTGGTKSGASE